MTVYKKISEINLNEKIVVSADPGLTAIPDPLVVNSLSVNNLAVSSLAASGLMADSCIVSNLTANNIATGQDGKSYGQNTQIGGIGNTAYTDNSIAEGEYTQAGTRSFRIVSGDILASTWTLKTTEGIQPGYAYTVRLLNNYDMAGTVVSVLNEHVISVDGFPVPRRAQSEYLSDPYLSGQPWYGALSAAGVRAHPSPTGANEYQSHIGPGTYPPESCFYDFDFDANTMWFLGHPEIGDISAYATGAHSEGYMTCAGRQYSHAEGLYSITVGKYAHAEGYETIAVWAAHSEGYMTSAFGQRSHAQGSNTLARGSGSLACGVKSRALGDNSFAYNGVPGTEYGVSGDGEFGINPNGDSWGFYIGNRSLQQIINDAGPDKTWVNMLNAALSVEGHEYHDVQFNIISGMHINTNPDNGPIGQPINANTSAYVGEYCGINVNAGEQYEISTRLGDRMCIMLFEKPFIPLSSYSDYMLISNYQYKKFDVEIPDGCNFMTIDNYTKSSSQHMPISVRKQWPKYGRIQNIDVEALERSINSISDRVDRLENDTGEANAIADSILNG